VIPSTIYLRTALFSVGGPDAHVPPGTLILRGDILAREGGVLRVDVRACLDEKGRVLAEPAEGTRILEIPMAKVDHLHTPNP
jgi:hypothetical protein